MIERYLIHYFLAVMDLGNFSRAAQQCRVSQPTLSVGIAKLEALVGHMLFNRTNRRVELTSHGATFAIYARRIEAEFARAAQAMAVDQATRLVRVGIISTLPTNWIEAATRAACQVAEETLELVEGRMRDLPPRLERGRIDAIIGIVGEDARPQDILFEEDYVLALPEFHPLAQQKAVEPEEIADSDMIVRRNCEALADVSRFFTQRGVRPFFTARTTNEDMAASYVRSGLGVTVIPRSLGQAGIATPILAGFTRRRRIGLIVDPAAAPRVDGSEGLRRFAATLAAKSGGD